MIEPEHDDAMSDGVRIWYDGDCPICSRYVTYARLRDSVGRVELINAREHPGAARRFSREGLDLDEGMVAEYGGRRYHGAECVQLLALLSSPSGVFNRLNGWMFRSATRSRLLYPAMRGGRSLLLKLLRRGKLADMNQAA